jgi:hypothetical protein
MQNKTNDEEICRLKTPDSKYLILLIHVITIIIILNIEKTINLQWYWMEKNKLRKIFSNGKKKLEKYHNK